MQDIEKQSRLLINKALALHASDIHFHPKNKETAVLFRVKGKLHFSHAISTNQSDRLTAHFKFRAGMDIGEQRRPQNGSIFIRHTSPAVHLRFSTIPSQFKESLSIRILPQNAGQTMKSLSFDTSIRQQFTSLMNKPNGMIVLTGSTGSGKTTTLYTLMNEVKKQVRVISIEDPVEIKNDAYIQMSVNTKAGLTYAELLKASLRQDPDVIMVGEIRDAETARLAVRAALTGHLVLTTMHAKSPVSALQRFYDFGCTNLDLKETLLAVSTQKLVLRYCSWCAPSPCSPHCSHHQHFSRFPIYDMLSGSSLKAALEHPIQASQQRSPSYRHQLTKAAAVQLLPSHYFINEEERSER